MVETERAREDLWTKSFWQTCIKRDLVLFSTLILGAVGLVLELSLAELTFLSLPYGGPLYVDMVGSSAITLKCQRNYSSKYSE